MLTPDEKQRIREVVTVPFTFHRDGTFSYRCGPYIAGIWTRSIRWEIAGEAAFGISRDTGLPIVCVGARWVRRPDRLADLVLKFRIDYDRAMPALDNPTEPDLMDLVKQAIEAVNAY